MKEGIYTVVFESSQQSVGEGVVVINNGRVHGGDMAFTIRGIMKRPVMELEVHYYNRDTGYGGGLLAGDELQGGRGRALRF